MSVPRPPGGSWVAFYDLALEVISCHFHFSHKPVKIQTEGILTPPPDERNAKSHTVRKADGIGNFSEFPNLYLESELCPRVVRI